MKKQGSLSNLEALLDARGEITIGSIGPISCVATASDDDDLTYAMLQRRPAESLRELLERLDATLAWAWENEEMVDEINPPQPAPKPAPPIGSGTNTSIYPPTPSMRICADIIQCTAQQMPKLIFDQGRRFRRRRGGYWG